MPYKHHSSWVAGLVCAASLTCCLSSHAADDLFFHYRAQQGDTLIGLGQSMLTHPSDWPTLAHINRIRNPRAIPVGTLLRIPLNLLKSSVKSGTILTRVGQATVTVPGAPASAPLAEQATLPAGSLLETGSDGWVTLELADGSVLRLAPSTQARLEQTRHFEGAGFFASTLSLIRGRIDALVTRVKGGEPRFEIKTPQAQLGVRGTSFRTTVDALQGETRSEVLTGAVAMAGTRAPVGTAARKGAPVLQAGFGARVSQAVPVPTPVPLLPAPDLSQLPTLHERPLVRLRVPTLPAAVQWYAEVALDEGFRQVAGRASTTTGELRLAGLPDGPYFLRVRGIDAQGLEGLDATTQFKLKARPEPPILSSPAPKAKVRAREVTLSWAQQEAAGRYHLQVAPQGHAPALLVDDDQVTGTTRSIPLAPGTYTWRLASIRPDGDKGPWGDAQHFVVKPLPADVPPPTITDTHLQFAWAAEAGQTFEFQVAKDRQFSVALQSVALLAPQVQIDKPATGGQLYIRYRAIDADGYVGPYTSPQLINLPLCALDREGRCIQTRVGGPLESR